MVVAGAASIVEAAFTAGLAAAHSVAGEAFVADTAAGATMEAFIEASGGTADSVIPTSASAWALVSTPGLIGLDRITATTDIRIIRTTGAILTARIPAIRMVTARTPTVRI